MSAEKPKSLQGEIVQKYMKVGGGAFTTAAWHVASQARPVNEAPVAPRGFAEHVLKEIDEIQAMMGDAPRKELIIEGTARRMDTPSP